MYGAAKLYLSNQVYGELEVVKKLTQWHPVSLEKDRWKLAIGNPGDGISFEKCELSSCCPTIVAIRSILFKCQEDSGLIERDTGELHQLLNSHEYPCSPDGERPRNLDEIIKQLGLLDSTNHT